MSQYKDHIVIKQVANRIKAVRTSLKLTQQDVYNDTGVHIGRIEACTSNASISTIKKLCDYFNLTLQDFFSEGF